MKRAVVFLGVLGLVGCKADTPTSVPVVAATPTAIAATPTANASPAAVPTPAPQGDNIPLSAYIDDDGACVVSNHVGQVMLIRYRQYAIPDRANPMVGQVLRADYTTEVPSGGVTRIPARANLCGDLLEFECGRGDGLLTYRHIDYAAIPCPGPTPTPSPTPSPSPTPCAYPIGAVTVKATTNSGTYRVYDGPAILWEGYLAVGQSASFPTEITGHTLTFRWQWEILASVVASCPTGVTQTWRGTMTFSCSCPGQGK